MRSRWLDNLNLLKLNWALVETHLPWFYNWNSAVWPWYYCWFCCCHKKAKQVSSVTRLLALLRMAGSSFFHQFLDKCHYGSWCVLVIPIYSFIFLSPFWNKGLSLRTCVALLPGGGGGVTPRKIGWGMRPASQNPYMVLRPRLRFFLPYLWPEP